MFGCDGRHRSQRRRPATIGVSGSRWKGGFDVRSSRTLTSLVGLTLILFLAVPGASAVTTGVGVGDNFFTPATASVALGGSVHWSRVTGSNGLHNVAEQGGIFRSGAATTGAINFTVTFSAGTFRYWCEVHAPGMSGMVKVKPKVTSAPIGLPFTVAWAAAGTTSGSKFDAQYRIGSGAWRNWKEDTTTAKAVFGASGSPVSVKAGTTYSFRARSQSGAAISQWSPIKSFTP